MEDNLGKKWHKIIGQSIVPVYCVRTSILRKAKKNRLIYTRFSYSNNCNSL